MESGTERGNRGGRRPGNQGGRRGPTRRSGGKGQSPTRGMPRGGGAPEQRINFTEEHRTAYLEAYQAVKALFDERHPPETIQKAPQQFKPLLSQAKKQLEGGIKGLEHSNAVRIFSVNNNFSRMTNHLKRIRGATMHNAGASNASLIARIDEAMDAVDALAQPETVQRQARQASSSPLGSIREESPPGRPPQAASASDQGVSPDDKKTQKERQAERAAINPTLGQVDAAQAAPLASPLPSVDAPEALGAEQSRAELSADDALLVARPTAATQEQGVEARQEIGSSSDSKQAVEASGTPTAQDARRLSTPPPPSKLPDSAPPSSGKNDGERPTLPPRSPVRGQQRSANPALGTTTTDKQQRAADQAWNRQEDAAKLKAAQQQAHKTWLTSQTLPQRNLAAIVLFTIATTLGIALPFIGVPALLALIPAIAAVGLALPVLAVLNGVMLGLAAVAVFRLIDFAAGGLNLDFGFAKSMEKHKSQPAIKWIIDHGGNITLVATVFVSTLMVALLIPPLLAAVAPAAVSVALVGALATVGMAPVVAAFAVAGLCAAVSLAVVALVNWKAGGETRSRGGADFSKGLDVDKALEGATTGIMGLNTPDAVLSTEIPEGSTTNSAPLGASVEEDSVAPGERAGDPTTPTPPT